MFIRRSRWVLPVAPLALALVALTACTEPVPPPRPSPTTTPVFENEEQALAAVTATYQAYLDVSNVILTEGGIGVDRIDAVVGPELVASERESLVQLADEGKTLVGAPTLIDVQLSEWYAEPDAADVLAVAAACIDISAVQVLDANGVSTVKPDRPRTRTWAIKIGPGSEHQAKLVLLDRTVRSEGESCES